MSAADVEHYHRLKAEVAAARTALNDRRGDFEAFRLRMAGIALGDIVKLCTGELAKAVEVQTYWVTPRPDGSFGKPWIRVHLLKKDGSWSSAVRNAYDQWELASPTPAERSVDHG